MKLAFSRGSENGPPGFGPAEFSTARGGPNYKVQLVADFVLPDLVLSTEPKSSAEEEIGGGGGPFLTS